MKLWRFLTRKLFITSVDPQELLIRIEILEKNEAVLTKYIVALSRLGFINPTRLKQEADNTTANTDYISALYDKHTVSSNGIKKE